MNARYLLVVILAVVSVAHQACSSQSKEHDSRLKRSKRQTSADQMVQNILQWLQGVYTQNSRRIRQGTLREYLPPANTQRPRPFQPGYPPAGAVTPQPPFPVFTNPATGAVTAEGYPSAPAGFEPPLQGVYPGAPAQPSPPFGLPEGAVSTVPPASLGGPGASPTTYLPPAPTEVPAGPREQPDVHSEPPQLPSETPRPAVPTQLPGEGPAFPTHPAERPGFPTQPPPGFTAQPGFPTGYPSDRPGFPTIPPSTLFPLKPGFPTQLPPGFPSDKPGFPTQPPPTGYPEKPSFPTGFPSLPPVGFPTGFPSEKPGFPTEPPTGYPSGKPGFPTQPPPGFPSQQPGGFPTQPPTAYPSEKPGFPTQPPPGYPSGKPGFPTQPPPGFPGQQPGGFPTQLPTGFPTQPPTAEPTQPPTSPPSGYPSERPGFSTQPPSSPEGPGPAEGTTQPTQYTTGYPTSRPGTPTAPSQEIAPSEVPTGTPEPPQPIPGISDRPEFGTSQPAGFTTQPPQPEAPSSPGEAASTPPSPSAPTSGGEDTFTSPPQAPESNTIPGGKAETPEGPAPTSPSGEAGGEDELRHPPHIHAIDVQCAKDMMTINIEFNRVFDGVIYSKGYYIMPECRYVKENSGQTKYSFTVSLNSCGTEFINAFDTQGQSYLENILVLQNEPGIQEVWDTVRSVRCLWEGSLKESLSVALSVGMLNQEIVTFSGDTAMAKLDINLGRGPFGQPANGLVKIGEPMTLVVSVSGDSGFDIQVKDCRATDSSGENNVQLTDDNGCILKPKLFGAFQKTRNTGDTGASIIAFAYFNAFKFPDVMDLMIECNIELCKTDCEMCPDPEQKLEPSRRRKRDLYSTNNTLTNGGVTMGKHLMVVLTEDLLNQSIESVLLPVEKDGVCMSTQNFVFSAGLLISLLITSCTFSIYLWLQKNRKPYLS